MYLLVTIRTAALGSQRIARVAAKQLVKQRAAPHVDAAGDAPVSKADPAAWMHNIGWSLRHQGYHIDGQEGDPFEVSDDSELEISWK